MTMPLFHSHAQGAGGAGLRGGAATLVPPPPPAPKRKGRLSSWLSRSGASRDEASAHEARRHDTRQLLAQIGDFLAAHDLAPSDMHLRMARSYILGDSSRIVAAINAELARGEGLDPDVIGRLIDDSDAQAGVTAKRMAAVADTLTRRLKESERVIRQGEASTRDYEIALTAEADALDRDPQGTVSRLIDLTAEAVARTQQLAEQLDAKRRETEDLRTTLKEAQRAADEDHLTGLPNRRSFDARLHQLVADPVEEDAASRHSVAICDIDNFKSINDRHGHATGDRVLTLIGKHLCRELGAGAFVARHGGEEFACLFADLSPVQARDLLDAAREALAVRSFVNQASGEGIGQLTFSAGVATLCDSPAGAMRTADEALYLAKRRGKNRVVVSAPGWSDESDG
jgi:diguanylate cyclase